MIATCARSYTKDEKGILATLIQGERRYRPIALNRTLGGVAESGTIAGYYIHREADATSSYSRAKLELVPSETTAEAILEIRRLGGLKWEEIGNLFRVSRRSVYNWANGQATTAPHEHSIRQALKIIRRLDTGSQVQNRSLLLTQSSSGQSLFEILRANRFKDAAQLLAPSRERRRRLLPLAPSAQAARRPPVPAQLLEAEQEPPKTPAVNTRIAHAVRLTTKKVK